MLRKRAENEKRGVFLMFIKNRKALSMEAKFLSYIGNKKEGTMTIKTAHPLSPFRRFEYKKGVKLRVGVEIPDDIAEFLIKKHKGLFIIESVELNTDGCFKDELLTLICNFEKEIDFTNIKSLISTVLKEKDIKPKKEIKGKLKRK